MALTQIFVDMDGVLADFHHGFCELYDGRQIPNAAWPPGALLEDVLACTHADLHALLDRSGPGFWRGLRETPFAAELFMRLLTWSVPRNVGLSVLSDPGYAADTALGKLFWLLQHFPTMQRHFCLSTEKWRFAHGGAVLLDDRHQVAESFYKAGGHAIVIPQPWNDWLHMYQPGAAPDLSGLLEYLHTADVTEPVFIHDQTSYERIRSCAFEEMGAVSRPAG